MSKALRKHRPAKIETLPAETRNRRIISLVVIAILAAVPFFLGKYFEFNSPGPFDSGSYVYSAAHILAGAQIGVEEKPSALLGTLLVNILGVRLFGFNETGPKLIQMFMQAGALVFMFIAMRKLFGILAAAVGVIMASVYLSAPLIAKFGNVKEQYMIACMVMGVSCFVLYQLGGNRWQAFLAGLFVSWAPLFKPTGASAIGAMGLFVILQPFLKNRSWRQTGIDILLLLAGAVAATGPLYIWILGWNVQISLPYSFVWETLRQMLPAGGAVERAPVAGDYISRSRNLVPFSQQWPRVLRYYSLLILPISLAVGSIVIRAVAMVFAAAGKSKADSKTNYDRFVLLFAVWWVLDMAFVWVSPRSYEQYYLPLNASAAMLGGYLIAAYCGKLKTSSNKILWRTIGLVGFLFMIAMSWHIFFGIKTSPHSGTTYLDRFGNPQRRRGYAQKLEEVSRRRKEDLKAAWEFVGDYIRVHSEPTDKIYVWGWVPGIYVKAQRFSVTAKACTLPRPAPKKLAQIINALLADFEKERPKFIVDTRKRHIPVERPPYELWPTVPKGFPGAERGGFLPLNRDVVEAYDRAWGRMLRERFDEDEALRYEAMKPFRGFIMKNYKIIRVFGQHVLFERK